MHQHASGAFDQRLHVDRRQPGAVFPEHGLRPLHAVLEPLGIGCLPAGIVIGAFELQRLEKQRTENAMKEVDAAQADRADRIPVITFPNRKKEVLPGLGGFTCCQYWKAIFMAISLASDPESE